MYRLFSWEHSYFSGKARAYLRFKERAGSLAPGWEDVLATPELITGLLIPRSGSNAVPQLEAPDGTCWWFWEDCLTCELAPGWTCSAPNCPPFDEWDAIPECP